MVPRELDEAARIDGASETQRFFHVYFPLIAPTFTNVVVLMYIWTLGTFEIPFLLGGMSGGVAGSMDTIQLFFYRTVFGRGSYSANFIGLGSAISAMILVILASGSLLLQRFLGRRQVEY
jgi:raffinose/stachyose/melibiose transport system permease protein